MKYRALPVRLSLTLNCSILLFQYSFILILFQSITANKLAPRYYTQFFLIIICFYYIAIDILLIACNEYIK